MAIVKDEMFMRLLEKNPVICLATERLVVSYTRLFTSFMCVTHPVYYSTLISNFESVP